MANMLEYLKWRGDLSFAQDPFNDVDNIILSMFSYTLFNRRRRIIGRDPVSIRDLSGEFFKHADEAALKKEKAFTKEAPFVMREMAESARFCNAKARNFESVIDVEKEMQFAAVEIELGDGSSYIAFRGTDDTLVGWKEDFALGSGIIPSEEAAVDYLNRIGSESERMLRIGGHSKGGHLAVYAAALCYKSVQNRILTIYDNDGPGFSQEFFAKDGFIRIKPRIRRIIPESSIVGAVLEHNIEPIVIKSSEKGLMQHDAMSWQIEGKDFVKGEKISGVAAVFNESLDFWINDLTDSEINIIVDDIIAVLDAPQVETLTQLRGGGIKGLKNLINIVTSLDQMEETTKKELEALLKTIVQNYVKRIKKQ